MNYLDCHQLKLLDKTRDDPVSMIRYSHRQESEKVYMTVNYPILIYILEGEKIIDFMDEQLHLKPGDSMLISENRAIMSQIGAASRFQSVIFLADHPDIFRALEQNFENFHRLKYIQFQFDDYIDTEIRSLEKMKNADTASTNSLIRSKLLHIIDYLGTFQGRFSSEKHIPSSNSNQAPILQKLQPHISSISGLQEMAALCSLSVSSLGNYFRKKLNTSPKKWLELARIELAKEGLKNSSRPIIDICFQSGFQDVSTFIRAFKRHTAKTPGGFRKEHTRNANSDN